MLKLKSGIITAGIIIILAVFWSGSVQAATGAFSALCKSWDSFLPIIDTTGPGVPIVVFNPLPWVRTDAVEVESPFSGENTSVRITAGMGRVCAAQTIGDRLFFTARNIPAMGYRVFWANRVSAPVAFNIKADSTKLENQYIRLFVDPKLGVLTSILDKTNNRQMLASGAKGLLIQSFQNQMASSEPVQGEGNWKDILDESEVVLMDSGPVKATMMYDHEYNGCRFVQQVTVHEGIPRIDVRLTMEMQGTSSARLLLPLEIPYGISTFYKNTSSGSSKWSVLDISQQDFGISFISDRESGLSSELNTIVCSFDSMNSGDDASEICFSIYPHKDSWRNSNALMSAFEVNEPLIGKLDKRHNGKLPSAMSYFSIDNPSVSISSIKRLKDNSILMQINSLTGKAGKATITTGLPVKSIVETDAAGNSKGDKLMLHKSDFTVSIGAGNTNYYRIYPE